MQNWSISVNFNCFSYHHPQFRPPFCLPFVSLFSFLASQVPLPRFQLHSQYLLSPNHRVSPLLQCFLWLIQLVVLRPRLIFIGGSFLCFTECVVWILVLSTVLILITWFCYFIRELISLRSFSWCYNPKF